jgi:hypothetical protein
MEMLLEHANMVFLTVVVKVMVDSKYFTTSFLYSTCKPNVGSTLEIYFTKYIYKPDLVIFWTLTWILKPANQIDEDDRNDIFQPGHREYYMSRPKVETFIIMRIPYMLVKCHLISLFFLGIHGVSANKTGGRSKHCISFKMTLKSLPVKQNSFVLHYKL